VRHGFHPKLGARTMRDAVEKLMGDAVSECLLEARAACGVIRFVQDLNGKPSSDERLVADEIQRCNRFVLRLL